MDLPNRTELEARLTTRIDRAFASVRNAALQGRQPDVQAMQRQVGAAVEDQARAVYVIMFLLFLDDDRTPAIDPAVYNRLETFSANRGLDIGTSRAEQLVAILGDDLEKLISRKATAEEFAAAFDRVRAEIIGITETTGFASRGYIEAAEAIESTLGIRSELWWVTAKDDRVCSVCGPLHATPKNKWPSQFQYGPPAHPNCRCTIDVQRLP